MEKPTKKERFLYWFDNRMSKSSLSLIHILVLFSVLLVLLMSGLILLLGLNEEHSAAGVIWDGFSTIINAWMPSSDEGSVAYLLIMAVIAVSGLLVTSVLIGIVTSAMEERIMNLRRGNSNVLEEGHVIILGFFPGEYTLIRQLILAHKDSGLVLVIGSDMERDEAEQYIKENIDVPKNVRIIFRTVDIFDPSSIAKLSVHTCRNILISPMDDQSTVKALLAVSALITESGNKKVRVSAITSREENRFPPTIAKKHNVTTLQTNDTMAKIIAHSCTQTGLSEVFREIFNFEGSEMYIVRIPETAGLTFSELMYHLDCAVPIGVLRDYEITLNPPGDFLLKETDRILVFSEEKHSVRMVYDGIKLAFHASVLSPVRPERDTKILVFGYNETLRIVLRELPENVQHVTIVNYTGQYRDVIGQICAERGMTAEFVSGNTRRERSLLEIARNAEHIIILTDHDGDEEKADMDTIFLLLNLRDLRAKYHLRYNITAEMRSEMNQNLVVTDDHTDYIVASNMASLFLAELADSPELISAFRELLSNEGNELYMKKADNLNCLGDLSVSEIRQITFEQGYIFLGYIGSDGIHVFNPGVKDVLHIRKTDSLIVLGRN